MKTIPSRVVPAVVKCDVYIGLTVHGRYQQTKSSATNNQRCKYFAEGKLFSVSCDVTICTKLQADWGIYTVGKVSQNGSDRTCSANGVDLYTTAADTCRAGIAHSVL